MYENIIYLLVVVLVFSTRTATDPSQLALSQIIVLFCLKGTAFWLLARRAHGRIRSAAQYFSAQQRFSILAIVAYAMDIYLLGGKYFLAQIPPIRYLPSLLDMAGLGLFFLYLAIYWGEAVVSYRVVFGRDHARKTFIWTNLKNNLPIVLPWLCLSVLTDLLRVTPIPFLNRIAESAWGESVMLLVFFAVLVLLLPVMVQRLWNCTPMPAGPVRDRIESLCRQQGIGYANIMLWPLFEGRALSAGVMGLIDRFRYVLITPALLEALTPLELDAVMAHEIGHVKHRHLLLYVVFFLGFAVVANFLADPIWHLVLGSGLFYRLMDILNKEPQSALSFLETAPLFVLMILYFRYIFGFFMRNFERQADLHAFKTMETGRHLIQSLEKIGWLSGNIRELPSWHHFGIGERVEFLQRCETQPSLIRRHDRKVYGLFVLYLLGMACIGILSWKAPLDSLANKSRGRFLEAVLERKTNLDPYNPIWYRLLGDLHQESKAYANAVAAYEKALELAPEEPEVLNNFAWLLLTATDRAYVDEQRALRLAQEAAAQKATGYILDTLANAYWANGSVDEALQTERRAIREDPAEARYYRRQMEKFVAPSRLPDEEE